MYFYQIINLFNDDIKLKDEAIDNVILFPLIILLCVFLYGVKRKLAFYINAFELRNRIEKEINEVKRKVNDAER